MVGRDELVAGLAAGEPVVAGDGTVPDWRPGADSADPPPGLVVPAGLLREVLLMVHPPGGVDPRGLVVRGAVITGALDLKHAILPGPLALEHCLVTDALTLEDAHLTAFSLAHSTAMGEVSVSSAHVGLQLDLKGATLGGAEVSLRGDDLRVDGYVYLDGGFSATGEVRLPGAHIGGQLNLTGAALHGPDVSLNGHSLDIALDLLGDGVTAAGAFRLRGARIGVDLDLGAASLDGTPVSLEGDGLDVGGNVYLGGAFSAAGEVRLLGADIAGQLNLRGAELQGAEVSLNAEGLTVAQGTFLDEGFTATGGVVLVAARLDTLNLGDQPPTWRLGDATGWRLRDAFGVIRYQPDVAALWLDGQESAQPWHELAAVYERNGQPTDGRRLRYLATVREVRYVPLTSRPWWSAGRWVTGHGYYPLRTAAWLLAVFLVAAWLTTTWAGRFETPATPAITQQLTAIRDPQRGGTESGRALATDAARLGDPVPGRVPAAWCSLPGQDWDTRCFQPWWQAATVAVPAAAGTTAWEPADTWLTVTLAGLRGLAWILTALLLAGLTGLLRRQD